MITEIQFEKDFAVVVNLINDSRYRAFRKVNVELIDLYWNIGKYICERVEEAGWGKSIVMKLSEYIVKNNPEIKGFTTSNLWRMKQFYETYPNDKKLATLWRELSWSHNRTIFSRCKTHEEREFYLKLCIKEKYSVRELERQIDTAVFERTLLADKKLAKVMKELPQETTGIFRDKYLFEFLDLPDRHNENDLRLALVANLKKFILELGKNFAFIGQEYRVQVGNKDFYLDLLFYHRELQCLVAVELKIDEFKPEYLGKMDFYLEALDRDVRNKNENQSIGILLCKGKDDEVVKYSLRRSVSPAVIADYETKLIPKKLLQQKLHEFYELVKNSKSQNQ